MNKVDVNWEVTEYCNNNGNHVAGIRRDKWEACKTEEERDELIKATIEESFAREATWTLISIEE